MRLTTARSAHAACLLQNGAVLLCGGYAAADHSYGNRTASAERYDAIAGVIGPAAPLPFPVAGHQAVALHDGTVLVPSVVSSALYDPTADRWRRIAGMKGARADYTATLLSDGRVLVAGGYDGAMAIPSATAEIYDHTTGTWTATAPMRLGRLGHAATALADGSVLVTAGVTLASFDVYTTAGAEIFDPATATWEPAGLMAFPRHSHTATLLADGTVLVAGGNDMENGAAGHAAPVVAERFDPTTRRWDQTAALSEARAEHTAVSLQDGRVMVAGGALGKRASASVEIFDPATATWAGTAPLKVPRRRHTATLLPEGTVLVAGGDTGEGRSRPARHLDDLEIYRVG